MYVWKQQEYLTNDDRTCSDVPAEESKMEDNEGSVKESKTTTVPSCGWIGLFIPNISIVQKN